MRVLLFSGGLDSTALAHWLRPDKLLFIDYGQVQAGGERRASLQIAQELGLALDIRQANCRSCGGGDMAGAKPLSTEAPEFWPYRNQLLITLAAMTYASSTRPTILIGTVNSDHIHPDGRAEFIAGMQHLLECQGDATIDAPALELSSIGLLKTANVPASILAWTFSCHQGDQACGQCRGCHKHFEALAAIS